VFGYLILINVLRPRGLLGDPRERATPVNESRGGLRSRGIFRLGAPRAPSRGRIHMIGVADTDGPRSTHPPASLLSENDWITPMIRPPSTAPAMLADPTHDRGGERDQSRLEIPGSTEMLVW